MNDLSRLQKLARAVKTLREREERERCETSLSEFVRCAWSSLESVEYEENWAIDALCLHLQAVTEGNIKRFLANYPPRCSKSNITSILWPIWTWIRTEITYTSGPQVQFLTASYSDELSLEFANKMRAVMRSPWFQKHWGSRFQLRADQNAKSYFANTAKGSRQSTSVGGGLIGKGGAILIADDLHNTQQAESEADRLAVERFWREFSTTRLNSPHESAIVAIMQRVHEEDVSGLILKDDQEDQNWVYLMIPMEYDPDRHCVTGWVAKNNVINLDDRSAQGQVVTWEDPRSLAGELMWPARFSPQKLATDRRILGPFMYSGRYQQDPVPAGGGILKSEWWRPWTSDQWPVFDYIIASLDTAYTEKQENDPSAMTTWGVFTDEHNRRRVMMIDAWSEHLEFNRLVEKVARTCKACKVDRVLIEAKAAGISAAQELRRLHSRESWSIEVIDPGSQDKQARAHSIVPLFEDGVIYAPGEIDDSGRIAWRDWVDGVIRECASFPKGKHDDRVDTVTQALRYLRSIGLAELGAEIQAAHVDSLKWRSPKSMKLPYVA